jgi:hypothetical protein
MDFRVRLVPLENVPQAFSGRRLVYQTFPPDQVMGDQCSVVADYGEPDIAGRGDGIPDDAASFDYKLLPLDLVHRASRSSDFVRDNCRAIESVLQV